MDTFFRPVDLARAVGVSTQMVRKYEYYGFFPPVERSETGYRRYRLLHLHALQTARLLATNYGWESALRLMQHIHKRETAEVLITLDAYHADIHHRRQAVEATLEALRAVIEKEHQQTEAKQHYYQQKKLHVREAAHLVGVRASAIRFWEEQGLLHPQRERVSKYRLYDKEQIVRLRIIVLLREVGYDFEAIHAVLTEVALGQMQQAVKAAERRRQVLLQESERCCATTSAVWSYLQEVKDADEMQ
jgi:DNA-binding transcriptional MerR regulator